MPDIQFDNEQDFARPARDATEPRGMVMLLLKWGLAKDEKTAQYLLLGVVVVAVLVAFVVPLLQDGPGRQKPAFLPPDAASNPSHP